MKQTETKTDTESKAMPGTAPEAPLVNPPNSLNPPDGEIHPFLTYVRELADRGPMKRFSGTALLGVRSVKFLYQHKTLWPNTVAPALINTFLFVVTAAALLIYSGPMLESVWAQPESWYMIALWWLVRILTIGITFVLAYVSTMIIGAIIASPFLTALSERSETIMRGVEVKGPDDMASNIRGAVTAVVYAICYFGLMIPILMLNLIPIIGSVASTFLGGIVSSFFLGLEYTDFVLDRRGYTIREKFRAIADEKPFAMGFGLGTSILLWVPLVNFLCMPIAVVGGTAVGIVLDEKKGEFGKSD